VAVTATLAVSGLSACRSAPDVAMYFGSRAQVSLAEVERIYNDAETRLSAARSEALEQQQPEASAPPLRVPITSADVLGALAGREIGTRIARQRNVTPPATDQQNLGAIAQALGLPPEAEYTKLYADNYALFNALLQGAKPAPPNVDDLRSVYDALQKAGSVAPDVTFESFRSSISPQNQELLNVGFSVRNEVRAQLDQANATVNPRLGAADIDVVVAQSETQGLFGLISVPVADPNLSPVTDLG
jgi:hypothetical protein